MACLVLTLGLLSGCHTAGRLAVASETRTGVVLHGDFTTAYYGYDDRNTLHVVLLEGPADHPTQAVHLRMYWYPRAGRTPVDPRATNAAVSYVVFTGTGAGVYRGAGFLFPDTYPGKASFTGDLQDSALRLLDASGNFVDRLGRARATGQFTATRDDAATLRIVREVEKQLHQKLGYPAFVSLDAPEALADAQR